MVVLLGENLGDLLHEDEVLQPVLLLGHTVGMVLGHLKHEKCNCQTVSRSPNSSVKNK